MGKKRFFFGHPLDRASYNDRKGTEEAHFPIQMICAGDCLTIRQSVFTDSRSYAYSCAARRFQTASEEEEPCTTD